MDYFFRNGEGDEVIFVHEGHGHARDDLRRRARTRTATTSSSRAGRPTASCPKASSATSSSRRRVSSRSRGATATSTGRSSRARRTTTATSIRRPTCTRAASAASSSSRFACAAAIRTYVLDYHPFDVVGWDGFLYPWTFSIHDFEPITGRIHQPPPSHQTFQGQNFVICSFCPRKLDFDPEAVPIPYHHSNLQSEEMIYYVSGNFGSRKGISVGSITLHPSGLPHGPQPGLAEKSLGVAETTELAVMCDTFRPLKLSTFARDLDDGRYAYSWYEPPCGRAEPGRRDEPPVAWTAARFLDGAPAALRRLPALRASPRSPLRVDRRRRREPRAREQPRTRQPGRELSRRGRGLRRDRRLPRRQPHRGDARQRGQAVHRHRQLRVPRYVAREGRGESRPLRPRRPGDRRRRCVRGRARRRASGIPTVGVWYYDAAHSFQAQIEGLRIAEPLLVSGALVIVDDTDWDDVDRATGRLPRRAAACASRAHDRRRHAGAPQWWEGMQVLVWDA